MKTIVLAATKGGVGKSTLCSALAVQAVGEKKMVGMLDIDPQGSLTQWWARRGEVENPKVYSGIDTISEAKEVLEMHGLDYLLIDTGPGLLHAIEPAIEAADVVIVPVKPSAFDLEAVDPVLEVIQQLGKHYLMVLNEIDTRSTRMADSAHALLKEDHRDSVAEKMIGQRTAYRAALTLGKSGPEVERDGKCSEEIATLWGEVKKKLAPVKKGARVRG